LRAIVSAELMVVAVPGLLAPFLERPTAKPKSTVDHSDSPLTVAAEPENDVPNSSHFNV